MRRRAALWAGGILLLAAALALRLWPGVDAELEYLRRLGGGDLGAIRCVFLPDRREVALESDGLTLRGDLYEPERRGDGPPPGIVLLHGSSVHGRRLPLYPSLAHELAARGYAVLSIDLRGFGDSEDPAPLDDPASWAFAHDAITAMDSLLAWLPVDTARIFLIGHSFGAGPALAAAGTDERVAKVVMIGPTRRRAERFLGPNAPDSAYYVERWQRDMRLAAQVPYDVMVEAGRPHDVENYANGTYTARVPVLLTDGEHEDPRDLAFLRDVAARMGPETDYWTTPGTDHYLHTDRLIHEPHRWATDYLKNVPCYDERVLGGFVTAVDRWLRTGVAPGQ